MMKVDLPDREFGGYIFDLDGTLIHSMPVHFLAWDAAMQNAGIGAKLDEDLFYSLGGMPTPLVAEKLGKHYGIQVDGEAVAQEKEEIYLEMMPKVELITPVVDFARDVAQTRPVAIATGGAADVAIPTLEAVGLRDLFKIVVTPADVAPGRGKPAPDMFLEAARRIAIEPGECVVFEDAVPGIEGAKAAGMAVVEVPSRFYSSR
ncbi:MAG: HAD-IA family hydrolase [Synoicihabitans sp.]